MNVNPIELRMLKCIFSCLSMSIRVCVSLSDFYLVFIIFITTKKNRDDFPMLPFVSSNYNLVLHINIIRSSLFSCGKFVICWFFFTMILVIFFSSALSTRQQKSVCNSIQINIFSLNHQSIELFNVQINVKYRA